MIIILLDETEGELVIDQEVVYSERKESAQIFNNILYLKLTVNINNLSYQRLLTLPENAETAQSKI